jgi:phenylacetic acid degradation operon negative regulatory protein
MSHGGPAHPLVAALVEAFRRRQPVRAGSLIVTVFGDAVAPRGGTVSLASLTGLLQAFGLSPGLVRTAVSRLAADGWLGRSAVGRRGLYSLTEHGRRQSERAARRIYGGPPRAWAGTWQVALVPGGPSERREALRRDLAWLGFGQLAPGVMLRPVADGEAPDGLDDGAFAGANGGDGLVLIDGRSRPVAPETLARLAADCWSLDALAAGYAAFVERFDALRRALAGGERLTPLDCLLVRLLLVHEYRRLVLRDPMLPREMLPDGWAGADAHALCRGVYRAVVEDAEGWVSAHLETDAGPLPPPDAAFAARFGETPG